MSVEGATRVPYAHKGRPKHLLRAVLALLGIAVLLVAIALGVAAAWIRGTFEFAEPAWRSWNAPGVIRFDVGEIDPPTGLAVIDVASLQVRVPFVQDLGSSGLEVGSNDGTTFVGVADAQRVDDFLSGRAYDVAVRSSGGWSLQPVPGFGTVGDPAQVDWTVVGEGARPEVSWPSGGSATVFVQHNDSQGAHPLGLTIVFTWPGAGSAFVLLSSGAVLACLLGGFLVAAAGGRPSRGRHVRSHDVGESQSETAP